MIPWWNFFFPLRSLKVKVITFFCIKGLLLFLFVSPKSRCDTHPYWRVFIFIQWHLWFNPTQENYHFALSSFHRTGLVKCAVVVTKILKSGKQNNEELQVIFDLWCNRYQLKIKVYRKFVEVPSKQGELFHHCRVRLIFCAHADVWKLLIQPEWSGIDGWFADSTSESWVSLACCFR